MCKCGRVSCHDIYDMFFINMFSLLFEFLWQLWRRPTKWMWRYYPRRAAAPPFCVVWCPRLSRNWYEWSRGFMNPLSTSIPRCKAVSSEEDGGTSHTLTHTHTWQEKGLSILCRICLVVCLLLLLLLTWHHQELRLAASSASLSLCSGLPSQQSALFVCSICLTCLPA